MYLVGGVPAVLTSLEQQVLQEKKRMDTYGCIFGSAKSHWAGDEHGWPSGLIGMIHSINMNYEISICWRNHTR